MINSVFRRTGVVRFAPAYRYESVLAVKSYGGSVRIANFQVGSGYAPMLKFVQDRVKQGSTLAGAPRFRRYGDIEDFRVIGNLAGHYESCDGGVHLGDKGDYAGLREQLSVTGGRPRGSAGGLEKDLGSRLDVGWAEGPNCSGVERSPLHLTRFTTVSHW